MPTDPYAAAIPTFAQPSVRFSDRMWDAAATLLVSAGVGLFFFARRSLADLGDGVYAVPQGATWVSRADLHVAQSRLALWVIAIGVLLGIVAAVRHRLHR